MTKLEEKNWMVSCHLGGLVPFYFLGLIIPFAIWYSQRSKSNFIDEQAKEAFNFQVSLAIYALGLLVITVTVIGIPITILGNIFLFIFNIIYAIKAALRTAKGEALLSFKFAFIQLRQQN